MLSLTGLTYRNVKENIAREPVLFFYYDINRGF